ncbi:hypothetical protein [Asticcacaulis sp. AC402]|uniref:hypothetical protein n=1 Tax=Asticcacaulis sp. AC402 TaxID=1282361 RepID=UPI0003C3E405|nr:hypothetical protein [Asticcacaulis sp. AC402]ESQ74566.1 hypothetical protein ABAC402_13850 [Asticcacaulis sp. AC402]
MKKVLLACGILVLGIGGQLAQAGDKPKTSVENGVSLTIQGQARSETTATMVSETSVSNDNPQARASGVALTVNGNARLSESSSAREGVPKTKSNIKND